MSERFLLSGDQAFARGSWGFGLLRNMAPAYPFRKRGVLLRGYRE